jgi:hypothetical protein
MLRIHQKNFHFSSVTIFKILNILKIKWIIIC